MMISITFLLWCVLGISASSKVLNTRRDSEHDFTCDLKPYALTVDHLSNPEATVDPDSSYSPRFSWKASSDQTRTPESSASRVEVKRFGPNETSNILWDSGWLFLGRSNGLDVQRFEGQIPGIREFDRLFWRAQFAINSSNGTLIPCGWSDYHQFIVGPSKSTWSEAGWLCSSRYPVTECDFYDSQSGISAAPLFRTEFEIPVGFIPGSAFLFASGLGHYEAWLNGLHVNAQRYLDPAPASYNERVYYNTFDVTENVKRLGQTRQVLGMIAGNGWYNPLPLKLFGSVNLREALSVGRPRVRCVLVIHSEDTNVSPIVVTTNISSWRTTSSGLMRNDLYIGNIVDMDRYAVLDGWSTPEFSPFVSADWKKPVICNGGNLSQKILPQPIPPIRSRSPHLLRPVSEHTLEGGDRVLDMGMNTAAVVWLELAGPSMSAHASALEVEFRFGELIWSNGTVNSLTSIAGQIKHGNGGPPCAPSMAYQRIVLHGRNVFAFNFTSQFTWHGFRYIQVSGLPENWDLKISVIPIMSDIAWTTDFKSSNTLLNKIFDICVNTHASNMLGIQSDCPHRERFGYTGDALATLDASLLLFDGSAFYEKRLYDMQDAQRPNGGITETAPFVGISSAGFGWGSGPIGWGSYFTILQLGLIKYVGNIKATKNVQSSTRRWISLLETNNSAIDHGLGDWMAVDPTPVSLTGRAFLIQNLRAWTKLCDPCEIENTKRRIARELDDFQKRFLNHTTGDLTENGSHATQTGQAMGLFYRLVPKAAKMKVISSLVNVILKSNHHISTGMFGIRWLFETLEALNHSDLAWKIVMQTDYPSYGYMLRENATTLWESWHFSNSTFSHNHPMMSGVLPWILGSIGGIRVRSDAFGADRLLFAPTPPRGSYLKHASFTLETVRGTAMCKWKCLDHHVMHVNISCPVNTIGEVKIPGIKPIMISGGDYFFKSSTLLCAHKKEMKSHLSLDVQ